MYFGFSCLFHWFLFFIFSVLCFEVNVISKFLFNFVLTLFKPSIKIKQSRYKKHASREDECHLPFIKKDFIQEKAGAVTKLKLV